MKEPRIFDRGKEKSYLEKLKMPHFDFTDREAEALTTFLLSLRKSEIPLEKQKILDIHEGKVEVGRLLSAKYNCQGCHTVDGKEGDIRQMIEDLGNAPPILDGEGAKVREGWLYRFLESPTPIRPWLKYRMPTFGFDNEELESFVEYFHYLAGAEPSYLDETAAPPTQESIDVGRDLFRQFQCIKCHKANPDPGLSSSFLAPNLTMAKDRLKPHWMVDWLREPQELQEGTMMPTFFADGQTPLPDILDGDAEKQIKAMRDYMLVFNDEEARLIEQGGNTP